jgi:hypothetical protein
METKQHKTRRPIEPDKLKYGFYEKLQALQVKDLEPTKEALCKAMDIEQYTLRRYIKATIDSTRHNISPQQLAAAAKVLGCSIEELIRDKPKTTSRAKKAKPTKR